MKITNYRIVTRGLTIGITISRAILELVQPNWEQKQNASREPILWNLLTWLLFPSRSPDGDTNARHKLEEPPTHRDVSGQPVSLEASCLLIWCAHSLAHTTASHRAVCQQCFIGRKLYAK